MKHIFCYLLIFCLILGNQPIARAESLLNLPQPGTMVDLSPAYAPLLIKGLKVHPDNPLLFDFILDTGHSGFKEDSLQLRQEGKKLIKYFLATLTIRENDLWVNLSPYEKNRIVPKVLGQTELGRDMLAQDYMLKQLTASLIYPEKRLGQEFWQRVYKKAAELYGATEIPVNTFNKVWIMADKAKVYVHDNTAFIVAAHLKVMLEEDYLATRKGTVPNSWPKMGPKAELGTVPIIREIILPEIEKEVNQGKNFAPLRQIYYSMIMATWYKKNLKAALLNQVYADKSKINGVDVQDKAIKEKIYQQYLQAYKKGVFNYIKDPDPTNVGSGATLLPRKYFSGGEIGLKAADVQEVGRADRDFISFAMSSSDDPLIDMQAGMNPAPKAALPKLNFINFKSPEPILRQIRSSEGKRVLTDEEAGVYAFELWSELCLQQKVGGLVKGNMTKSNIQKALGALAAFVAAEALYWHFSDTLTLEEIRDQAIKMIAGEEIFPELIKDKLQVLPQNSVLVGGGSGFIGTAVEKELEGRFKITTMQHTRERKIEVNASIAGSKGLGLEISRGDFRDRKRLDRLMARPAKGAPQHIEAVLQFGGISSTSAGPGVAFSENLDNLLKILKAMRKGGVKRLIFASSVTVYDDDKSPYAETKRLAEKLIRDYCAKHDIKYVILRLANVVGVYPMVDPIGKKVAHMDKEKRFTQLVLAAAFRGEPFPLKGNPDGVIPIITIKEAAAAAVRAFDYLRAGGESTTVDIVPQKAYSKIAIIDAVGEEAKNGKEGKFKFKGLNMAYETGNWVDLFRPAFNPKMVPGILENPLARPDNFLADQVSEMADAIREYGEEVLPPVQKLKSKEEVAADIARQKAEEIKSIQEIRRDFTLKSVLGREFPDLRLESLVSLLSYTAKMGGSPDIYKYFKDKYQSKEGAFSKKALSEDKDFIDLLRAYESSLIGKKDKLERQRLFLVQQILRDISPAMLVHAAAVPGGIDLNAKDLAMSVEGDNKGINMHFDPAMIAAFKKGDFSGVSPVILTVTTLPPALEMLGLGL